MFYNGYGDPWGVSYGRHGGGALGVYGAHYGATSVQVKIGRLEAKLRTTRNPRQRQRLVRKLNRLKAKASGITRRARRGGRRIGSRIALFDLRVVPKRRPLKRRPLKRRPLKRRLKRREERLQARLLRRQMRQQARAERKAGRQSMKDGGYAPIDPMSPTIPMPSTMTAPGGSGEYMDDMESGMISDPMALPGAAADAQADLGPDYDEGPPWGKIALVLGLVAVVGVGIKAASGGKKKSKSKSKAKAPASRPASRPAPRPAL